MSTTNTYSFGLENADVLTEAFERIGVRAASITGEHIASALRSISLLFVDWHNRGMRQYKVEHFTLTPTSIGQNSFTLNPRVLRIFTCVHRITTGRVTDTPVYQIGRQDYDYIANKTQTGSRTDRIFLDKQRNAPVAYVWPAFDTLANSLILSAIVRNEDVGYGSDNPDIPYIWYDAICASLARRLAEKYAESRLEEKVLLERDAVNLAMYEDSDNGPTQFTCNLNR